MQGSTLISITALSRATHILVSVVVIASGILVVWHQMTFPKHHRGKDSSKGGQPSRYWWPRSERLRGRTFPCAPLAASVKICEIRDFMSTCAVYISEAAASMGLAGPRK